MAAPQAPRHFAVIGAGIAGIACARTLAQAGHSLTVFDKAPTPGGRMASLDSPFGQFDAGAHVKTHGALFAEAADALDIGGAVHAREAGDKVGVKLGQTLSYVLGVDVILDV